MEGDQDLRTFAIIGVPMEVHKQLGHGFLKPVYQEAMAIELGLVGIPYQKEVELPVVYKGKKLKTFYKADFLCFESVMAGGILRYCSPAQDTDCDVELSNRITSRLPGTTLRLRPPEE